MAFEAVPPSGNRFTMDSSPDHGGTNCGPSPVEALLAAAAACTAMDVISIMTKKQQKVTSYEIEIAHTRGPEGIFPRPITSVTMTHIFKGENLDESAIERSVQLSDEKYCTVVATLRENTRVKSEWRVDS